MFGMFPKRWSTMFSNRFVNLGSCIDIYINRKAWWVFGNEWRVFWSNRRVFGNHCRHKRHQFVLEFFILILFQGRWSILFNCLVSFFYSFLSIIENNTRWDIKCSWERSTEWAIPPNHLQCWLWLFGMFSILLNSTETMNRGKTKDKLKWNDGKYFWQIRILCAWRHTEYSIFWKSMRILVLRKCLKCRM